MKLKYKKENSPRMQSAINRTFHAWQGGWWMRSDVRALGMCAIDLAYGADKYDVMNRLSTGHRNKIVTFARGDIRRKYDRMKFLLLLVLAMIVLLSIVNCCEPDSVSLA